MHRVPGWPSGHWFFWNRCEGPTALVVRDWGMGLQLDGHSVYGQTTWDDSVLPHGAGTRSVCPACKAPLDPRIDSGGFIGSGTFLGPRVSLDESGSDWTWTRPDREGAET
ncbi:hypothetical protein WN48_04984 [Eufriesea mexicana]|nr:hypothetical protein WN48_04984 [Eufriesea mexicana]